MAADRNNRATQPFSRTRHEPVRTCIGCRRKEPWSVLVRVVAVRDDAGGVCVVLDPRRRMPGRGAWLHPDSQCVQSAVRRKAFGRALRAAGAVDVTAVTAALADYQQDMTNTTTKGRSDADEHPMRAQR